MAMTQHKQDVPEGVTKRCKDNWLACNCTSYLQKRGVTPDKPTKKGMQAKRISFSRFLKEAKLDVPRTRKQYDKAIVSYIEHKKKHSSEAREVKKSLQLSVASWVDTFLTESKNTSAFTAARQLKEKYGHLPFDSLSGKTSELVVFLTQTSTGKGDTYLRDMLDNCSAFYRFVVRKLEKQLADAGIVPFNPFTSEEMRAATKGYMKSRKRVVVFGAEVIFAIINGCATSLDKLRVRAALETGLRKNEMMQVEKWMVFDTHIHLPWQLTKAGKMTKRDERIDLEDCDPKFRQKLKERLVKLDAPEALVFGTDDGKPMSSDTFDPIWQAAFRAAGITCYNRKLYDKHGRNLGWGWHDLRHEFAWTWLKRAKNSAEVQLRGRWNDPNAMKRYLNHYEKGEDYATYTPLRAVAK